MASGSNGTVAQKKKKRKKDKESSSNDVNNQPPSAAPVPTKTAAESTNSSASTKASTSATTQSASVKVTINSSNAPSGAPKTPVSNANSSPQINQGFRFPFTSSATLKPPTKSAANATTNAIPMDELASLEFNRGNGEFQQANYSAAVLRYTKAIAMLATTNVNLLLSLLTNRAITQLYLKEYKQSAEDCQAAITLDNKCLKAYICRAFANYFLGHYEKSLDDFETSYKLQSLYPASSLVQTSLNKAREELISQSKSKKDKSLKEALNSAFFGLLTIDEEEAKPAKAASQLKNDSEPPLLIPIGDPLSNECNAVDSFMEYPKKEAEDMAIKEKELGNKAFAAGNYPLALIHYSKAIKLNWRESVFFSNRALVYLKMGRFYECISDCTASIDRKPAIKAYGRRATAWNSLKEYFLAVEDYKRALKFEPKNPDCLAELNKNLALLEKDYMQKLEFDPTNERVKKSLATVREDLRIIASKLEKEKH